MPVTTKAPLVSFQEILVSLIGAMDVTGFGTEELKNREGGIGFAQKGVIAKGGVLHTVYLQISLASEFSIKDLVLAIAHVPDLTVTPRYHIPF